MLSSDSNVARAESCIKRRIVRWKQKNGAKKENFVSVYGTLSQDEAQAGRTRKPGSGGGLGFLLRPLG